MLAEYSRVEGKALSKVAFILPRSVPVNCVGGVKVSIVAFQAIDPGSIPG